MNRIGFGKKQEAAVEDTTEYVWSWSSRAGGWTAYGDELCQKLTAAVKVGEGVVHIDSERHIDLSDPSNFLQRVTAAPDRTRRVKREERDEAAELMDFAAMSMAGSQSPIQQTSAPEPEPEPEPEPAPALAPADPLPPPNKSVLQTVHAEDGGHTLSATKTRADGTRPPSETVPLIPNLQWIWSWAKDSLRETKQDLWITYPPEICLQLEAAFATGVAVVHIDSQRHVDLSDPQKFVQRVTATPDRRRRVKREAREEAETYEAAEVALSSSMVCRSLWCPPRHAPCAWLHTSMRWQMRASILSGDMAKNSTSNQVLIQQFIKKLRALQVTELPTTAHSILGRQKSSPLTVALLFTICSNPARARLASNFSSGRRRSSESELSAGRGRQQP